MYLGGEEDACGGSDQCTTEETLQKAAAMAGGDLESWLGRVLMSCFSHVISCTVQNELAADDTRVATPAIGAATPNS